MAPQGPHQYSMVIPWPNLWDLGPFRPFWAQKNWKTVSKMAQTGPNPQAFLGGHNSKAKFIGIIFFTFSHLYIHRRNDLSKKLLSKNSHQRAGLYSFWVYHSAFPKFWIISKRSHSQKIWHIFPSFIDHLVGKSIVKVRVAFFFHWHSLWRAVHYRPYLRA